MTKRDVKAHREDTTILLKMWSRGSREAGERVLERLYPQLRGTAARLLERTDLTYHPSDVLNDVWLRLLDQREMKWQNRAHFFAIVARILRRVLADQSKFRGRKKRDFDLKVSFDETSMGPNDSKDQHFLLDQALDQLAQADPLAARTVELRYFCGLSFDETAQALELGRATAFRKWRFARAFLFHQLRGEAGEP